MGEFWNHDGCKEIPQILDWWDKYLWSLFFETTLVDYFVFAYHNTFSVSFKKYSIATVRFEWLSCIPIYQRKYILNHLSSNWFTRQYCMFLLLLYGERERFFLGLVFVVTMTRAINRCGCSDWFVQFQQNRKSIYVFNVINILPIHFHIKRWQMKRWAYVQYNYERNSICIFKRCGDKCIPLNI